MIIEPKVRGFICTAAHPTGCAQNVAEQIDYVKKNPAIVGPKRVLVIGASTGYGLASYITAAFGCQAQTMGVFFERPAAGKRTASAGWYNYAAFEQACDRAGAATHAINGDAFSDEIKRRTIELIQRHWQGEVDLVIYSIASPRRAHPKTGQVWQSVLKPTGEAYDNKTVDMMSGEVSDIHIDPASQEEIDNTVAVMGGDDWRLWVEVLSDANVLAEGAMTVAYSYIGPELTYPIYRNGTIGLAKADLERTAGELNAKLQQACKGRAYVAVNKCVVTQASAAIPVVPLYTALMYKAMKAAGTHEGCIEQIYRLFADRLYADKPVPVDTEGRIRLDELELDENIQKRIATVWPQVTTENLETLSDIADVRGDFYKLFGFGRAEVDYKQDIDPVVAVPSLSVG